MTKTYNIGDNLAADDNETKGDSGTKNLAADGQLSLNKDCVFIDVVVVSGDGCEGGAPTMGLVTPQRQDRQQQGGGRGGRQRMQMKMIAALHVHVIARGGRASSCPCGRG